LSSVELTYPEKEKQSLALTESVLVRFSNLSVGFGPVGRETVVVRNFSMDIKRGKTVALIGESGSGKSVTALALMGLLPKDTGRVTSGEILWFNSQEHTDLCFLTDQQMRSRRGRNIGMIFQEPMTALNPVFTVGNQLEEAIRVHQQLGRQQVREAALELLERVEMSDPERQMKSYPHELSGGMRQRVMIAMAFACKPQLLIADEPTTALDVTIQAQIMDLIADLQAQHGLAVLFITHDLSVVAETADDVALMYAGQIVESGPVERIIEESRHPYTRALLASVPHIDGERNNRLYALPGSLPNPGETPAGCIFSDRCPHLQKGLCDIEPPSLHAVNEHHEVYCHLWKSLI